MFGKALSRRNTRPYPPLYTPFKMASSWLVPRLRDSRVSSNALTVTWAVLLVAAAFAIPTGHRILAVVLVPAAVLLDCVDGDLARSRERPSVSGTLLEQLAHWIGNMSLIVGSGAALLLSAPQSWHILLISVLVVVQAVYIVVVRQIRPDAVNVSEHSQLLRVFTLAVRALRLVSPIELPIVAALIVFGPSWVVLLTLAALLTVASALIFVPHFFLIRAIDRRRWEEGKERELVPERAGITPRWVIAADWWVPGMPRLPRELLTLLSGQPVAAQAPLVKAARQDLATILPELFKTTGRVLPLACPEEPALEAVVTAVGRPGCRFLIAGGRVSAFRWRRVIQRLGMDATVLEATFGSGLDTALLAEKAAKEPPPRAVLLTMANVEDGTLTDLPAALRALQGLPSLIIADATLSFCADPLHMDEWGVDIAISSSASGVMAPPGLSLVALGPRALAALDAGEAARAGGYLDLRAHLDGRPLALPPAATLLGLHQSARMILDAGLDAVLAQQWGFAQRFRHRCAQEAGLTSTADFGSAACSAFYLPASIRLPQLKESLFALDRIVFAYSRGPGGTPTLNAGHCGQRGIQDIDRATAALADALRMSSV